MNFKFNKIMIFIILSLVLILAAACTPVNNDTAAEAPAPTEEVAAPDSSGDALSGKAIFDGLCSACHGPDATGVVGLGKNLIESEFVAGNSDAELAAFIAEGRPASHPDNTTGVDMPPRGGNPSLTDDDLLSVVAHLRSLVGE